MDVLEAMHRRASTRAYLNKPVDRATVEAILEAARWAPSGTNAQPWQVVVVTGETKQKISAALLAERQAGRPENPDYSYYPKQWVEPYKSRRMACGLALYQAMKIGRDDKDARLKAWNNNYSFFGAPVGLLFFLDRSLEKGSWVDMGMFIENVMLAAIGHGLATCPRARLRHGARPSRHRSTREQLPHRTRASGKLHCLARLERILKNPGRLSQLQCKKKGWGEGLALLKKERRADARRNVLRRLPVAVLLNSQAISC